MRLIILTIVIALIDLALAVAIGRLAREDEQDEERRDL